MKRFRKHKMKNMKTTFDYIKQLGDIIWGLNEQELICSVGLSSAICDHPDMVILGCEKIHTEEIESYKIGQFKDKTIYIDPYMKFDDISIFDNKGNLLIDLKEHGLTINIFI